MTDLPHHVDVTYSGTQPDPIMAAYRADVTVSSNVNSDIDGVLASVSTSQNGADSSTVGVYGQVYLQSGATGEAWAGCSELHDHTGASNPSKARIAHEFDVVGDGTDANGTRMAILIAGFQNTYNANQRTVISDAIRVMSAGHPGTQNPENVLWSNGIRFFNTYTNCVNTKPATVQGDAIKMATTHWINFDGKGKVQVGQRPQDAWHVDRSGDSWVIPGHQSTPLAAGAGMVMIHDRTHDDMALYLCCGGSAVMQGSPHGDLFVNGAPPDGKIGCAFNGSTYSVVNETDDDIEFNVVMIRTA